MNKQIFVTIALVFVSAFSVAQKDTDVLLTINDKPVYAKEFKQVYKKNLDLVKDKDQKTVEGYLDLFVDYKLKVEEAYAQDLHKRPVYVADFKKYEEQLARNYIYEKKLTDDLVEEAYARGLEEIEASHILINCTVTALPQDTLKAYNKIKLLRDRALKGEDFTKLVVNNSEEPRVKESKGKLSYFSVFTMVYSFENEAYNTPIGGISDIVRTQFGYHILKVTGRRERTPKISVSHIMISTQKDTSDAPEKRIQELYALLKQGEKFEDIASQFSDDRATGKKGGLLKDFNRGDLRAPGFEEAAYQLDKPGDLSKPVKSQYGWHIIRLEKKYEPETLEEKRVELERRVNDGIRSKKVTSAINNQIKDKYGFKRGNDISFFYDFVSDSILVKKWSYESLGASENKLLFKIGDSEIRYNDFAEFLVERQMTTKPRDGKTELLDIFYDEFETKTLKDYYKSRLEIENDAYGSVIREYRDGLLIFEVMGDNVWNKAKNDSIGQLAYYEKNKTNFNWKERVGGTIVSSSSEDMVKKAAQLMKDGTPNSKIQEILNIDGKINAILTRGIFEKGQKELPEELEFKLGVSKIHQGDNRFTVIKIDDVISPSPKKFEDVKGKVLSEYQNEVEKEWMDSLRKKYTVEVNQKTLKKLKKSLRK